jgi:hypothetical protein
MDAFAYGNLVDSSTLSGGSWDAAHPLTRLQLRELAAYALSSTSSPADTQVIIDHGSARVAQCFAIVAHNITDPAATITVNRGTTSGASDVYAGSPVTCWPFSPLDDDRDGGFFAIAVVTPHPTTARFTTIAINTSDRVRMGRLFVGPVFAPAIGVTRRTNDWLPDFSTVERTESGADWVAARPRLRHPGIEYRALSRAEGSLLQEIQRTHGTTGELFYTANIFDRADTQQHGCLAMLRQMSPLEFPFFGHNSVAIGFDERGGAP